jgi:hypothetical protein
MLTRIRGVVLNELRKKKTLPFILYNIKFLDITNSVIVDCNKYFVHVMHLTLRIFIACASDIHDKLKDKFHFRHLRRDFV